MSVSSEKNSIYIISKDTQSSNKIKKELEKNQCRVTCLKEISQKMLNLILQDCHMVIFDDDHDSIGYNDFLKKINQNAPWISTIVMASRSELSDAVEAVKLGAIDVIKKPFKKDIVQDKLIPAIEKDNFV